MCGIIGIVGKEAVSDRLVDGLKRMEYRGYDSAGVCTVHEGGLIRRRAEGKLANLVAVLNSDDAAGNVGIAHTRWPPTARQPPIMPIPMPQKKWRWFTMVLSKISNPCAKN